MTREERVEKMIEAFREIPHAKPRTLAEKSARFWLEEAAKECERMERVFAPQQVITDRCAAAIRAMIPEEK